MTYVELSHVSFAHGGNHVLFEDCDLRLERGITALVGENGAGKSTLLRLITGELHPTTGRVRVEPAHSAVRHVTQDVERAGARIEAFAESYAAIAHRLRAALELDKERVARWDTLSPGERRRFQLGAALADEPDVLLLDEPTNHVDVHARALLTNALRSYRGVALLVSHDRALIDALAQRTLRLHHGRIESYDGGYTRAREAWLREAADKLRERSLLADEAHKAQRRLDDARRRQAETERGRSTRARMRSVHDRDARSIGAKTLAAWAESRASRSVTVQRREAERAQAALAQVKLEKEHGRRIFAHFERCPRPVVTSLHADQIGYGDEAVLRDVRRVLRRDGRVRIEGPNGAGKSTLLRALYAAAPDRERLLWLPQELSSNDSLTLLENTRGLPRDVKGRVLEVLAALGVDPDVVLASARPSLGEARKVMLAHALGRGAWALLLDEPQNHLDLPSVERLEAALAEYPGALAVISHDADFARDALTETWTVSDGRVLTA